ncbi:MAG TPA: LemA family protein [Actinomycetota bacterium]|nr:LemA family protein [Actinomycetota bacterium]
MTGFYVVAGIVVVLLVVTIFSYNRFVNQQNLVRNAWSNVDTELKRRYDLIPNLVTAVKAYAAHERSVLEEVIEARRVALSTTGAPDRQAMAEAPLVAGLRHLMAVAEGYSQLLANRNFLDLQEELAYTEDRIQAARRFYNANVADYNRRVAAIPSNLVAAAFGFKPARYFQLEPAVRAEEAAPPATG